VNAGLGGAILDRQLSAGAQCIGSSTESGRPPAFFTYGVSWF
jgi:hypothetical protein